MASQIDPTKPETGQASTQSVRDNFQIAADEITALQNEKIKSFTAAEDIGGNKLVYLSPTGLRLADKNSVSTSEVLGVTVTSILTGQIGQVQLKDEMQEPSWTFTIGSILWLGSNGFITEVLPTSGAQVEIGKALTPTKILIDVKSPLYIN